MCPVGRHLIALQSGFSLEQSHSVGGYTFATTGVAEALGGGGFNRHLLFRAAEALGKHGFHGCDVRIDFGLFAAYCEVGIAEFVAFAVDKFCHFGKQNFAVDAFVFRVFVGEMVTDVAKIGGAEHGIAECVDGNIGIAMTQQTEFVRNFYSSEPKFTTFYEAVNVKSHTYTKHIVNVMIE